MGSVAQNIEVSEEGPGGDESPQRLTREDIFEVLSNRRRRCVLHYLRSLNPGETTSLSEIASQVAAWENDLDVSAVDYERRKSVQTSLYQLHLPKLAEKGVVAYDRRSNIVRRTATTERVDLFLETVDETELPWSTVFLGLSAVAILLSTAALMGVLPGDVIGAGGWMVLASTAFLGTSMGYAYQQYTKNHVIQHGAPPEDFRN